jgi:hypothetical protein
MTRPLNTPICAAPLTGVFVIPRKSNDVVFARSPGFAKSCLSRQLLRHISALPIVRDDANGFLVVARDHASHYWPPIRMKRHALAEAEFMLECASTSRRNRNPATIRGLRST